MSERSKAYRQQRQRELILEVAEQQAQAAQKRLDAIKSLPGWQAAQEDADWCDLNAKLSEVRCRYKAAREKFQWRFIEDMSPDELAELDTIVRAEEQELAALQLKLYRLQHDYGLDVPTKATAEPQGVEDAPVRSANNADGKATGWLSPADIAKKCSVDPEALRRRLERWRRKNDDGWMEVPRSERRSRDPKYLYRLDAIQTVIQAMNSVRQTSGG